MCVTSFDTIFEFPGQPATACGVLEKAGHGGVIPLDQCGFLPSLVMDACKCSISIPLSPNPPPNSSSSTTTPINSSEIPRSCPSIPGNGCSVCGPSMCVTDFDAVFTFPGEPSVACGVLEKAGIDGFVPLDQCGFLPSLVKDKCKCQNGSLRPAAPTRAPTPYPAPTQLIPTYPVSATNSVPTQLVPVHSTSQRDTCPDVPDDGCSVCGPGMCVTDFDAIFEFPGQPAARCEDLEKAGLNGIVPLSQCGFLPSLIMDKCECQNGSLMHPPTSPTKPTRTPTNAPLPNNKCPGVPEDGCSVCGPGMCVTDFDAIFDFPGQPAVRCGDLEKAGIDGIVPLDQCGFLPGIIMDECKCQTETLVGLFLPTRAPTQPSRFTPSPTNAWPQFTYPPFGAPYSTPSTTAQSSQGRSEGVSDGVIIGLTVGVSLLGIIISVIAVYLVRRKGKAFKDASTMGVVIDADGSSIMKDREGIRSEVTDEDLIDDPDLL